MVFKPTIRLTKRLGQHLLVEPSYLRKLIENSDFDNVEQVVEVGPGTGNLTELLVGQGREVLAVELDRRMCGPLKTRFAENFQLFEGDILDHGRFNPNVGARLKDRWAMAANLPYNVASPVIVESLYLRNPPVFMCVTIQKEVARRLAAKPSSHEYGALSVLVQAVSEVKIIAYVPPGAFLPPPKVHSAIIKIGFDARRMGKIHSPVHFRSLVGRLFRHRRKTLRSGWVKMLDKSEQPIILQTLMEMGIDPGLRPEALGIGSFVELSNRLFDKNCNINCSGG